MKSIQTRTYTNVALTAIIILLGVLVVRPYWSLSAANAQFTDVRNEQQSEKTAVLNPAAANAEATEKIADATRDVAAAIREAAKSQQDIAKALSKMSDSMRADSTRE